MGKIQVHWEYDGETLRIFGVGEVDDKNFENKFFKYADEAKTLVIGGGLTGIGKDTFSYYHGAKTIILEDGIKYIGDNAFCGGSVQKIHHARHGRRDWEQCSVCEQ